MANGLFETAKVAKRPGTFYINVKAEPSIHLLDKTLNQETSSKHFFSGCLQNIFYDGKLHYSNPFSSLELSFLHVPGLPFIANFSSFSPHRRKKADTHHPKSKSIANR